MTPSEVFCDPLDPSRSIQLNNRYWPGERYSILGLIREADAALEAEGPAAAARVLTSVSGWFVGRASFARLLRRLHRLHSFRCHFGCIVGRLAVPQEAVEANRYRGSATRASYPLSNPDCFSALADQAAAIYVRAFGRDVLKMHQTVRFAMPDERQGDVIEHGLLSDYHNDEYKGISGIVYLSDVREHTGAFSYIRDSHLIPRSLVLTAIHQSVHFDMQLTTPPQLASLPLEFRGSTGIGNLLEPEKAALLSEHRVILEGTAGTFVIFNGQYLLHRGGKPLTGTRTAAFFQPEGLLRHKLASVGSAVFGRVYGRT